MLVQQILASKPEGAVATIGADAKVSDAAQLLAERRIGCLVVSMEGAAPEGILSERDIVRALAQRGSGCLDENVAALMTPDPKCCSRDETADSILARMTEGRFRHMPVVEDGKLEGLISIGDVVNACLRELTMEKNALQGMIMGA